MANRYILKKKDVEKHFPETVLNQPDEDGFFDDLVEILSDKNIDIPEDENYVPVCFKSDCDIEPNRLNLIIKYIEKKTGFKNIYTVQTEKINSLICDYKCYIDENEVYISEETMNDLKKDISEFDSNSFFITSDPKKAKHHEKYLDLHEKENVWYVFSKPEKVLPGIKSDHPDMAMSILKIEGGDDGVFKNITPEEISGIETIDQKSLPSVEIPSTKIIGFVEKALESENPLYTPINLEKMISSGKFKFSDKENLMEILKNSPSDGKVKVVVTKDEKKIADMAKNLKIQKTNYLIGEKNGVYEIFYSGEEFPNDLENIDLIIKQNCLNHQDLTSLSPVEKLDIFVHSGYGFKLDKENLDFVNPYTEEVFPRSIIYDTGTQSKGIGAGGKDFHKNIFVDVPVEISIENIDNDRVAVNLKLEEKDKTIAEEMFLDDFPVEKKNLQLCFEKVWRKGHLLNDFGLAKFKHHGEIDLDCVCLPWWIQGKNKNQTKNLIKFISLL